MNRSYFFRRTWAVLSMVFLILVCLAGCRQAPPEIPRHQQEYYYTVEQAREKLQDLDGTLGAEIDVYSANREFHCTLEILPEEFEFVTISGSVEFWAEYEDGVWYTRYHPTYEYDWHVSGNWYAKTEKGFDVYFTIHSYTAEKIHYTAQIQKIKDNGEVYERGPYEEMRWASLSDSKRNEPFEMYLYVDQVDIWPEVFNLCIEKDQILFRDNGSWDFVEMVPYS